LEQDLLLNNFICVSFSLWEAPILLLKKNYVNSHPYLDKFVVDDIVIYSQLHEKHGKYLRCVREKVLCKIIKM